nr:hypothetical protein [bacterium]
FFSIWYQIRSPDFGLSEIVSINFIDENNRLNIIRKTTKPEEHHLEIYERLKINFSQLVIDNRK